MIICYCTCIDREFKRERKVVFANGRVSHICSYSIESVPKFSSDEEVCVFAHNTFGNLRSRLEIIGSWLDHLVRVDAIWNDMKK